MSKPERRNSKAEGSVRQLSLPALLSLLGVLVLGRAAPLPAQSQSPSPATKPAAATEAPTYGHTTLIDPDLIRRRPRQVIVLPSEPGEVGEDPLQLSSGVLGKLPTEARRLPEGYMVSGAPASVGQRDEWTILYIADEELFSLPAEGSPASFDSEGRLTLSPALMRAFQDNRAAIAADAEVITIEKGRRWRLADPERAYLVDKEAGHLSVRRARGLRVLPNRRLMMLEAIFEAASTPPLFVVTGRITEFQGVNYILLEHLAEVINMPTTVRDAAAGTPASESPGPGAAAPLAKPPAVSETPSQVPPQEPADEPRAEEIIAELMESKPLRAVVLPDHEVRPPDDATTRPAADASPASGRRLLWVEDTMLVDRPGRVVPGDRWWMFAFEDKGEAPEARPVPILPNRMLETALAMSGGASKGTVFIVSGEVTEYRGGNYLLMRKVLVQPDMGNLR